MRRSTSILLRTERREDQDRQQLPKRWQRQLLCMQLIAFELANLRA